MAVAFRSAASASHAVANPPIVTVSVPAGTVDNDVLVAFVVAPSVASLDTPAGWTVIASGQLVSNFAYMLIYRVASSEPGSYTFTCAAGPASTAAATILTYTGERSSGPIDVASTVQASAVIPSITTVFASDELVEFLAFSTDTFSSGPSATQRVALNDVSNDLHLYAYEEPLASAGATGSRTFTVTGSAGRRASVMVALRIANTAPNAPTLTAPIGSVTVDRAVDLLLQATFSDPDPGDTPSAWEWRYRVVGAGTWTTTGEVMGGTSSHLILGGTLSANDYEWQARSWDALGVVGSFSASSFFTASAAPTAPSITDPVQLGTIATSSKVVTISAPSLDSLQIRTVKDTAGAPDAGTIYQDTGEIAVPAQRSATIAFAVNGRTEHVQARIKKSTLWSAWATVSAAGSSSVKVSVSYTAPATPTATATGGTPTGATSISATHPAPSGSQPAVTSMNVWRRNTGDAGNGDRIAVGVGTGATFVDYAVASGQAYQYRVEDVGANGVSAFSAWV